jgi:fatty acid-binding protein DegV
MNDLYIAELSQDVLEVIGSAPFDVAVSALAEAAKNLANNDDDLTTISEKIHEILSE